MWHIPVHQQAEMQAAGIIKEVDLATPWINSFVKVNKNSLMSMAKSN